MRKIKWKLTNLKYNEPLSYIFVKITKFCHLPPTTRSTNKNMSRIYAYDLKDQSKKKKKNL